MVNSIPSISKDLFNLLCTILIVLSSFPNPSKAKYSHCTGIITLSDNVKAFNVSRPKDGEQSMTI